VTPALDLAAFAVGLGGREVVSPLRWRVAPGEVVGVVGPNGAGKSSLLRGALGLLRHSGEARLFGDPVERLAPAERARRVAWLPQERRLAWGLTARRVAGLGALMKPAAEADAAAARALARVGLARLADRGVFEMSGGERARVLIARLLAASAPLIVADEPTSDLDPAAQLLVCEMLREEAARGAAVILTLHDLGLAARFCDRLLVLHKGRVAADAPPREALSPAVLHDVFGLAGRLLDTDAGPLPVVRRSPAA